MAKGRGKKNGNKERASVSRERRLALALRAVLEEQTTQDANEGLSEIGYAADAVLTELGYGDLQGIPSRLKDLNEQLTAAVAAGDGATIACIGAEMVKVQAGKSSKSVVQPATKKSPRSNGVTKSTVSIVMDGENAIGASVGGE